MNTKLLCDHCISENVCIVNIISSRYRMIYEYGYLQEEIDSIIDNFHFIRYVGIRSKEGLEPFDAFVQAIYDYLYGYGHVNIYQLYNEKSFDNHVNINELDNEKSFFSPIIKTALRLGIATATQGALGL